MLPLAFQLNGATPEEEGDQGLQLRPGEHLKILVGVRNGRVAPERTRVVVPDAGLSMTYREYLAWRRENLKD
jgi:hypothetical protein